MNKLTRLSMFIGPLLMITAVSAGFIYWDNQPVHIVAYSLAMSAGFAIALVPISYHTYSPKNISWNPLESPPFFFAAIPIIVSLAIPSSAFLAIWFGLQMLIIADVWIEASNHLKRLELAQKARRILDA